VEAANTAQTVWVNTTCRKDHSQKIYQSRCCGIATLIASHVWETDNPVHKLMMDKPQPVLTC